MKRTKWFEEARFGLFLHWGLYSVPARGEWVMSNERMSVQEYERYLPDFTAVDYDPKEWARLAKNAGMKYAVLTAKHHDGFCLFDTAYTDYNSMKSIGRDLVREFLEAFRTEGIRVGLYFSLLDWHHKDFPKYADRHHPMRGDERFKVEEIDFDRYLGDMFGEVEELVSNYGKLDLLWFDFSYDDMSGEKWRAEELMKLVKKYQPEVLTDNRLETSGEGIGSIATTNPLSYAGDFVSPELILPPDGIRGEDGRRIPWELCTTMNNSWGYNRYDEEYKSSAFLIRKLVECVSKSGNMLLNVGPDAKGNFPKQAVDVLEGIGSWMSKNADSIHACHASERPKPDWGRYTERDNLLYAHIMEPTLGQTPLYGVSPDEIESMRLLSDGSEVKDGADWNTKAFPDYAFVSLSKIPQHTVSLPDEIDTVIEIRVKKRNLE